MSSQVVYRGRKSAKNVITDYARELLRRPRDHDTWTKLVTIEAIALRMNWKELYEQLRFKSGLHPSETGPKQSATYWWQNE
jgi:hypothetical protein